MIKTLKRDIGHVFFVLVAFFSPLKICLFRQIIIIILFVIQQIGAIWFCTITIKQLLNDILYFLVLRVLCVVPFLFHFMILINRHLEQDCIIEFRDYAASFYSMSMVMLNMINLRQYDLHDAQVIYMAHKIFIFMVGILLVNFHIAVMSDSAVRISERKRPWSAWIIYMLGLS